ncbi:hypothetical protein TcCL_NonESM10144 [Trypanosoma cruzi]|nr:hypothetical protein TcCL_NonESM10144 [Trypanosoma cruzi]
MASDDDSRCALGTHPHTLPCLSVGVIAAGHCCERDGDTTASPLEKVPRSVGCGAARRFACSPTDRTAQSFHCGHFVCITRCGGVRKSRSPDEDGLVVVWWLIPSFPVLLFFSAARLAQQQPGMALLQECRHESAPATRLIGCGDFHQACGGRAGGVAFLVRHTLPCERL